MDWEKIKRIFHEAAECSSENRESFLLNACGGDAELRAEVESLLNSAADKRTWEAPAAGLISELLSEFAHQQAIGTTINGYRLEALIGAGGMGTVYRAVRDDGQVKRTVAVKLIRPSLCSLETRRRFDRELHALSKLEHPGIARLIDGGVTEDGLPYLILEYINGKPIDKFCDEAGLGINDRLHLFRRVCEAVEFAHRHLIVHRDLKPKNILVTDARESKLLDFGIAKLLSTDEEPSMHATATFLRIMTPQYASPEQMRGEPVTTASDVYSLGVILYELLTGRRPYKIRRDNLHDAYRVISEATPNTPSEAITQILEIEEADGTTTTITPELVSRVRGEIPTRLRRRLKGDLDTIVMTSIHKDPARRYASVERLSEDIRRYLAGLPIRARRDTLAYRAGKFVKRNRAACAAGLVAVLALSAGIAGTVVGFIHAKQAADVAREQANLARKEARRSEQLNEFLKSIFVYADPHESDSDTTIRSALEQTAIAIDATPGEYNEVLAEALNFLAIGFYHAADYPRSEALIFRALEADSKRPPSDLTALLKNDLAMVLRSTDRYAEAETVYKEALALARDPVTVSTIQANLARMYRITARHAEAIDLFMEACASRERLLGADHPETLSCQDGWAQTLAAKGENVQAERLHRRVLQTRRTMLRPGHPELATSLNNLAYTVDRLGKYQEALALYQEALDIYRKVHGESHPHVANSLNNMASTQRRLGQVADAEANYRKALSIFAELNQGEQATAATVMHNLGSILVATERFTEGDELYRQALGIRSAKLGPSHPLTVSTLNNMAMSEYRRKEYALAGQSFEMLLAAQQGNPAVDPVAMASIELSLADTYSKLGRLDDALSRVESALKQFRVHGPANSKDVADALALKGSILLRLDEPDQAVESLRECLALRDEANQPGSWPVVSAGALLGAALMEKGSLEEAEKLILPAVYFIEADPEVPQDRVNEIRQSAAKLYDLMGNPEEAAKHRRFLDSAGDRRESGLGSSRDVVGESGFPEATVQALSHRAITIAFLAT